MTNSTLFHATAVPTQPKTIFHIEHRMCDEEKAKSKSINDAIDMHGIAASLYSIHII